MNNNMGNNMGNNMNNNIGNNMGNNMNNNTNMNITPHFQSLHSIFIQMVPGQHYNIDFGDRKNIPLSLIHSSVMILDHPHPLFGCLTPQRANYSNFWTCKKCQCNYAYTVPPFYCTICDFDICQKCMMGYPLYQIELYDYKNAGYNFNNVIINQQDSNLRLNLHNHPLKMIQIPNYKAHKFEINCLKCNNKINKINSNDAFFYCSLCNFYTCANCFNNSQMGNMQINQNHQGFYQNNQNQGFNQNNQNQGFNQINQNQGFNPNNQMQFNNPNQNNQMSQMQFNNQNQGFNTNNPNNQMSFNNPNQTNQNPSSNPNIQGNSNENPDYLDANQMDEKK